MRLNYSYLPQEKKREYTVNTVYFTIFATFFGTEWETIIESQYQQSTTDICRPVWRYGTILPQ